MELVKEYSEIIKRSKELKSELKDLKKKQTELEEQIKQIMEKSNSHQLGNVILYKKKVFKSEIDKKTVRDKIGKEIGDPIKTDNLTEEIFKKEISYKNLVKIIDKN